MKKIVSILTMIISCAVLGAGISFSALADESQVKQSDDTYFDSQNSLSVEYGTKDSRNTLGASVTLSGVEGQRDASIYYRNYLKASDLKDGFLSISFEEPAIYGQADFDYLFVELTDAVNTDEKLVWAVAPQPDTCGWWNSWTSAWISGIADLEATTRAAWTYPALLKIAGTEQTLFGYNNVYVNQWNVLYDGGSYYDAGYNIGAKNTFFNRPDETSQMDRLTFALNDTQATINNGLIANIASTEWLQDSGEKLIGTQYESVYTEERMTNLFSSGYCTLNIRFMGLNTDSITCHIKKIGNQVLENQDGNKVENATPYIHIDHKTHAVEGKPFALPKAEILDMREGDISSRATYKFFNKSGEEITYSGENITFSQSGDYVMRCSVTLKDGRTFFREEKVICYEKMPTTEFKVSQSLNGNSYQTGDKIEIPAVTATNLLSTKENGMVNPIVVLQNNGGQIARFNGSFVNTHTLTEAGNYTLAYLYVNEYGIVDSLAYSFTVIESIGIRPSFLPVSFTSGQKNTIADAALVDYIQGKTEAELYRGIYVNDELIYMAKGTRVLFGSLEFTKQLAGNSAELCYKAGYTENELIYTNHYTIPVINPIYAEDYIIISDKDGKYTKEHITMHNSNESLIFEFAEDTALTMPQRMSANGAELAFDIMSGSSFGKVNLIFTDYLDSTKQIIFTAVPKGNEIQLYINGKDAGMLGLSFNNDKDYFHMIYECDGVNNRLVNTLGNPLSSKIAKIESWNNGTKFEGFTDGTMVVRIEVQDVSGKTKLSLRKVNNQGFYTETIGDMKQPFSDYSAPVLTVLGEYKTRYNLGDNVTLYPATAFDVLKANANLTLTVKKPNGELYYEGSADTEKKLLLTEYGDWIITYSTHDGNDWFATEEQYILRAVDNIPPIITGEISLPKQLELNTEYVFPTADVFDNITQECKYYVIVSRPDAMREAVVDNKYTFTRKGMYIVTYYAVDDYVNIAQMTFSIWVE